MRTTATLLLSILLLAPFLTALLPPGASVAYADRKIGAWVGNWEKRVAPATYVQNFFLTKPFYSVAMIQAGVSGYRQTEVDWIKNVGVEASGLNRPEIEISVIWGFNRRADLESEWSAFTQMVDQVAAGRPAIKYIGLEGEFACEESAGCPYDNDPVKNKEWADRIRSIIEPKGFTPLHYFLQGRTGEAVRNDPNYPTVFAAGFPTWEEPAYVYTWYTTPRGDGGHVVGIQVGVAAPSRGNDPDAWWQNYGSDPLSGSNPGCGCPWSQNLVNLAIDTAAALPLQNRHFVLFTGQGLGPYDFYSDGNLDGAYYKSSQFREWVWARQQLYPEITWVGRSSGGLLASFGLTPLRPLAGSPVTFTATVTGGSAPYVVDWNFGDSGTGQGNPVTHTYSKVGDYTVTLTVRDSESRILTTSQVVTVSAAVSLSASIAWQPANPTPGQTVVFSGSVSGGTPAYRIDWHFGDGGQATGNPVSHTFSEVGTYSVSMEVTDAQGVTFTVTQPVTVASSSPPPTQPPPPGPIEIPVDIIDSFLRSPTNLLLILVLFTTVGVAFGAFVAKRRRKDYRSIILDGRF